MLIKILPALMALALLAPTGGAAAQPIAAPYRVGEAQVLPLSDGVLHNDFSTIVAPADRTRLAKAMAPAGGVVRDTSVNAYAVRLPGRVILIDAGAGDLFGPTLGKVGQNLAAAGVKPGEVTDVFITHLHPDHIGGLVAPDGTRVFPNAVIHLAKPEADYWLSAKIAATAPAPQKDWFAPVMKTLKPYADAGRLKPFPGPTTFFRGFHAEPTPGHTPGHAIYRLTSDGQVLEFWGDLVNAGFQFDDPGLPLIYDSDASRAAAVRAKNLARVAGRGAVIALAHQDYPGLGKVKRAGSAYRWVPADGAAR